MKAKGASSAGVAAQRYRPASEYDDDTLAQKREYWRNKKREQRARLADRRRSRPKQDSRGGKNQPRDVSVWPQPGFKASTTSSLQKNQESNNLANVSLVSLSRKRAVEGPEGANQSQKEKWFQTMNLNKVLPQCTTSGYTTSKTIAFDDDSLKCQSTGGAVSSSGTSHRSRPSGTSLNISASSVPPVRIRVHPLGAASSCQLQSAKGSLSKATPQRCASMQGVSVPIAQHKAQVAVHIQPKPLNTDVTTGLSSTPRLVSFKAGSRLQNVESPVEKKSALVTSKKAKSIDKTQVTPESEEERAAKRREHWRIKKREQRAKMAARLAKTREASQSTEMILQRQMIQKMGLLHCGALKYHPSLSSVRGLGQKQYFNRPKAQDTPTGRFLRNARVMIASSSMDPHASTVVKKEVMENVQSGSVTLATLNPNQNKETVLIKVENSQIEKKMQNTISSNITVEKKVGEHTRKLSNYMHFSNVSRGIARCRTPRQRFIETQKSFPNQRNMRGKFQTLAMLYNTRNVPKFDPNESPEQTAAKKREYWRIKKREQRAKLSLEVKNRLKEKDSLMRRVKRYQKILEDMRRARAEACSTVTQATGSMLAHASETIGGFIKEDGTVTINIPHVSPDSTTNRTEGNYLLSNNDIIQSHSGLITPNQPYSNHKNVALRDSGWPSQHPPPLRAGQVRVSLPCEGQSISKPPRLLSIRPRVQFEKATASGANPNRSAAGNPAQITLTHPPFGLDTGSAVSDSGVNLGGCVMKMAVSSSLVAPCEDPELTEEEKMAKKREYWRVKKREQRAARAARLKQGLLLARGNAALQRRKTHKQTALQRSAITISTPSGHATKQKVNILPPPNVTVPSPQQANQIKVEREPTPATDLNILPEQAICPNMKLPPIAVPQPEPDPSLSAESQATTLLAVASMKKLLEESLSTVTECKSQPTTLKTEQPSCKTEVEAYVSEENLEQEMKSNVPMIFLGDEDKLPIAANLTLEIKSWQADTDDFVRTCSPDPYLEAAIQTSKSPPPLPATTEDLQCTTSTDCSPQMGCSGGPTPTLSPPRRAKRLSAKRASTPNQNCCSSEPPALHHPPSDQQSHLHPCSLPQSPSSALQQECRKATSTLLMVEEGGMSGLQKKREYWKLMKRQQRARLKARQKGSLGHRQHCRQLLSNTAQTSNLLTVNKVQSADSPTPTTKRALQAKSPTATLTAVHSIPTLLVVSPTASNVGQSPDTLQVKPPVCSFTPSTSRGQNAQPLRTSCDPDVLACPRTMGDDPNVQTSAGGLDGVLHLVENQQKVTQCSSYDGSRVRKWTLQGNIDISPALGTLMPPDNPLASINLVPIEPLVQTSGCTLSTPSPVKPPFAQPPKPQSLQPSPTKLLPISTMVPPKPIPGESEEDFLRRKREYWRVKKKEQRARKAIRDRELSQRRAPSNWKPIMPAEDHDQPQCIEKQDSGHWVNDCEESEQLMSTSSEAEMGYFPFSSYTAPIEDDVEVLFDDGNVLYGEGDHVVDDGSVSDTVWRNRYLMDHDPLNQLLVCMVCGDLIYSHSLEGVRAHIEEAHPDTLDLEDPERLRILDAWDEQVSQRERFFTRQLRQQGATPAEANRT